MQPSEDAVGSPLTLMPASSLVAATTESGDVILQRTVRWAEPHCVEPASITGGEKSEPSGSGGEEFDGEEPIGLSSEWPDMPWPRKFTGFKRGGREGVVGGGAGSAASLAGS